MNDYMENKFSLKGQLARVTGAVHGIGFAIASAYARAGASIAFNSLNEDHVAMGLENCAKAVIPGMIEMGAGKIINICSEYGQYNIRCNGTGPGYIATPQTAPLRERRPDGSRHPFGQFIVAKTPQARWGIPEDLEGPALFLASHASDFVNGHILYVDGGILAYIGKQP